MKIENGHLHAWTLYSEIGWRHFLFLWLSLIAGKVMFSKSVTAHLPLEIQHPNYFNNLKLALRLIKFGHWWKRFLRISLYWENAPLLNYDSWDLKFGQTEWDLVPKEIDLCLDTGHLILGSRNVKEARKRLREILERGDSQIKHLHLHENDLVHDIHSFPEKILNKRLMGSLIKGKTYIFEK